MKKWTLAPLQIAPHGAMGAVVAGGMGRGCPDTLDMCSVAAEDTNYRHPNASGQRVVAGNSVISSL